MPYTPHIRTSRARFNGGLAWLTIPPYATFVVPYAFDPVSEAQVPDPIARQAINGLIDPSVGSWNAGVFTPARAGLYRLAGQFVLYQTYAQGQRLEAFFQLELVRQSLATPLSVFDVLDYIAVPETGEIVIPLSAEATVRLEAGDRVQARLGFLDGHQLYIVTDYNRSFLDVTAYWS